jgi:TetR/AcrR family transcriptional regulator of autoinduction and epiphytic fitness
MNEPSGDGADAEGRSARSQRTRDAVIDALLALIGEGDPQPGARRVAERAGVSTRTVFAHFATLEDLYRASVERATALVLSLLTPIDPVRPLAERIDSLCAQRARVNEEIGPVRRAAALRAPHSPTLTEARARARRASYEQIDRVFGAELDHLDGPARRRRRAAVDAAISGETWDLLRTAHGLPADEARLAVEEAVRPLLTPAVPAPPDGPHGPHGPARVDPEQAARMAAAAEALAGVELRIRRLVTAIESGSPADLLAPRLSELRAARVDAKRHLAELSAPGGGPGVPPQPVD